MMGRRPASRGTAAGRVVLAVWAAGLAAGCTSDATMTSPSASAPTISDLTISSGSDQTLVFRVTATDPYGDLAGGTCIVHAASFDVGATIVTAPGAPAGATTAVVACTVAVSPGASGLTISGTLSVTDAHGNPSNHLAFTTTLPERLAGAI
jgi:hypothetical protein